MFLAAPFVVLLLLGVSGGWAFSGNLPLNEFAPRAALDASRLRIHESLLEAAKSGTEIPDSLPESTSRSLSPGNLVTELDSFIKGIWDCGDLVGTAVSVVRRGEVVYAKGHGVRDIDSREPVDENTLFGIGSTTKAFTTTLIAMAVAEGKLNWDTPIAAYLPNFRLDDPYMSKHATLRDLTAHKLGIARHDHAWIFGNAFNDSRDALIHNMRYFPSSLGFRTQFQYNNFAYVIAGEIVARAYSTSWEKLVEERIFKPLDMVNTSVSVAEALARGTYAIPFGKHPGTGEYKSYPRDINQVVEYMCAAGCILSSAKDMAHWLQFQAGRGAYRGEQLVDTKALLRTQVNEFALPANAGWIVVGPQRPEFSVGRSADALGLGWGRMRTRGFPAIFHGGGTLGHGTQIEIVQHPRAESGVFASQISGSPKAHAAQHFITAFALDLALDLEPWFDADFVCRVLSKMDAPSTTTPSPTSRAVPASPPPLRGSEVAQLAGSYFHRGYGLWKVDNRVDSQVSDANSGALSISFNRLRGTLSGLTRVRNTIVADLNLGAPWDLILSVAKLPKFLVFELARDGFRVTSFSIPSIDSKNPPAFRRVGSN